VDVFFGEDNAFGKKTSQNWVGSAAKNILSIWKAILNSSL